MSDNIFTYITIGLRGGELHVIGADFDKKELLRSTLNLVERAPFGPYQALAILRVYRGGGVGDLETLRYIPSQRASLEPTGDCHGMHLV